MPSPAPNSVVVPSVGNRPPSSTTATVSASASTMLQTSLSVNNNNNNIVITSTTSDVSNIASTNPSELNSVEAAIKGAQLDTMMVTNEILKQPKPNVEEEEDGEDDEEEEDEEDEDGDGDDEDDENDEMEHQTTGSVVDGSSNPKPDSNPNSNTNPNLNPNLTLSAAALEHVGASGDEDVINGEDLGDKGSSGTRWPRQEALALLKIRSDMDKAFKDNSPKAPLWEQVSSKMAELGYQRTAKKCKEKFENMHKYYKRTKEGKSGRPDGKNYRFFNQLEALYGKKNPQQIHKNNINHINNTNNNSINITSASIDQNLINGGSTMMPGMNQPAQYNIMDANMAANYSNSIAATPLAAIRPPPNTNTSLNMPSILPLVNIQPAVPQATSMNPASIQRPLEGSRSTNSDHSSTSLDSSFESSDEDDEDDEMSDDMAGGGAPVATTASAGPRRGVGDRPIRKKKKRKVLKKYLTMFRDAMNKILDKQEEMQQRFLEALERRDKERMMREDAWRRQEMARLNMETEMRAQETAVSSSRDSAIIDLLQKLTGHQSVGHHHQQHQYQHHHQQQSVPMSSTSTIPVSMPVPIRMPSTSIPMSSGISVPIPIPSMPSMPTYNMQPQHDQQTAPTNARPPTDDSSLDYKDVSSSHDNKDAVLSPRSPSVTAGGTSVNNDGLDRLGNNRWPKPEVLALIKLRTTLDKKFHEPGSKAVLWEEISKGMLSQGYNRTAKRCKEKWENINKYFKKAKDNNKKRPEDAKTCPYFHQLNALYKQGLLGGGYNLKQRPEPVPVDPTIKLGGVDVGDSSTAIAKPIGNAASTQSNQDVDTLASTSKQNDKNQSTQIGVGVDPIVTTTTTATLVQNGAPTSLQAAS